VIGRIGLLLTLVGLGGLTACRARSDRNSAAPLPSRVTSTVALQGTPLAAGTSLPTNATSASSADKLIALTFDDGPRPYVLFGAKDRPAPSLVDVLDSNGIKATFFVVGWRLTPKTWGEPRHEEDIGMSCIDAAEQLIKRGHELEDHTYSHMELRSAEMKKGEPWVISDVDRGAQMIKAVTGTQPKYVRPPDWVITEDARRSLEQRGYRILTISSHNPVALRDVNSLDYLCGGKDRSECPKPSLVDAVLKQIDQREKKGIYTHILAFHELSTTAAAMPRLIGDLKARGYRFVTVTEYMNLVAPKAVEMKLPADAKPLEKSSSGKSPKPPASTTR
jgi:peptidoglycan/xylan/chitin deacetylase (PgdA/CDA1 family)